VQRAESGVAVAEDWADWQELWFQEVEGKEWWYPTSFRALKLPFDRKGYEAIWCGDEIMEVFVRPTARRGATQVMVTLFREVPSQDPTMLPIEGAMISFPLSMVREMVQALPEVHAPHRRVRNIRDLVRWVPEIFLARLVEHGADDYQEHRELPPNVKKVCPDGIYFESPRRSDPPGG
jgi:hypothetical protein